MIRDFRKGSIFTADVGAGSGRSTQPAWPPKRHVGHKGAVTDRMGYTHPNLAVRPRPTPWWPRVQAALKTAPATWGQWRISSSRGLRPPDGLPLAPALT